MHVIQHRHLGHPLRLAAIAALVTVALMVALTGMSEHGAGSISGRFATPPSVASVVAGPGPSAGPIEKTQWPAPFTAPAALSWAPSDSWQIRLGDDERKS